jgi:hypothetical protein
MYLPKNQYQPNLYSNGEKYALASTPIIPYIGDYFLTSSGKAYTGKQPSSQSKPLTLLPPKDSSESYQVTQGGLGDEEWNEKYAIEDKINDPQLPTEEDYKRGEYIRYFTVRRNQNYDLDKINKKIYDQYNTSSPNVQWLLYRPFYVIWQLTGDINHVSQTNNNMIKLAEQNNKVTELASFLNYNYTEYYRPLEFTGIKKYSNVF